MPNFNLREKKSIFIPKTEKEIERFLFAGMRENDGMVSKGQVIKLICV